MELALQLLSAVSSQCFRSRTNVRMLSSCKLSTWETMGRKQEIRVDVGPSVSIFIYLTLDLIHKRHYSNPIGEPGKKKINAMTVCTLLSFKLKLLYKQSLQGEHVLQSFLKGHI